MSKSINHTDEYELDSVSPLSPGFFSCLWFHFKTFDSGFFGDFASGFVAKF